MLMSHTDLTQQVVAIHLLVYLERIHKTIIMKEKEIESEGNDVEAVGGRRGRGGNPVIFVYINEIQKINLIKQSSDNKI